MTTRFRFKTLATLAVLATLLTGCGYSAVDGELIGQAKKITHVTPLICPDYMSFDISLGVMQNGTGSMSTQDVWLTVYDPQDLALMERAVADASIVRVRYSVRRWAVCTDDDVMTHIEIGAPK